MMMRSGEVVGSVPQCGLLARLAGMRIQTFLCWFLLMLDRSPLPKVDDIFSLQLNERTRVLSCCTGWAPEDIATVLSIARR